MATKLRQNLAKIAQNSCRDYVVHGRNVVNGSSDVVAWTLVPILDLIKIFEQYPLFCAKNKKIAYTRNGKDTPNIQMGITSFPYKISTQFLRV